MKTVNRIAARGRATVLSLMLLTTLWGGGGVTAAVAADTTVYDGGGFEAVRFIPLLALEGQDRWLKDPGTSKATVSTNSPNNGLQSVQVIRAAAATGDSRWYVETPLTPQPRNQVVRVAADMRVNLSGFRYGPAFGLEAYDGASLVGAFSVDSATGDVLYVQSGTKRLLATGTVLRRGVYHRFRLETDFAKQSYSVYVNDSKVWTEPFVSGTARACTAAAIATYSVNSATAASETGTAYFDNVSVTEGESAQQAPPAPVTRLTAQGGKGEIGLTWTASEGAATYNVYRGDAPIGEDAVPVASGITETRFTDGSLGDGETYYYRVTAVNGGGESDRSNEVSATTAAPDLAVRDLTSDPSAPGVGDSVTLTAVVTNQSAATTAEGRTVSFADNGSAVATATVPSLAPGQSATVRGTWTPDSAGAHTLTATATSLKGETDTANNTAMRSVTVYTYYTYTVNASLVGTGSATRSSQNKVFRYNIGVPMNVIKEVRVVAPVSTYDNSASVALGASGPYLESFTSSGSSDLARIGSVTPTGTGNWVMSSDSAAVTTTIRPLADNYIDLYINGLGSTETDEDQVKVSGITIQIKYLAP